MKIGIDMDEVIVEFTKPFLRFYNSRHKKDFRYEEINTYNLWECLGISKEIALKEADEFYKTKEFENAEFVEGAREGLTTLARNNNLFIVTSRPLHIKDKTDSFYNKNFPGVPVIYSGDFLNKTLKKSEICREKRIGWFVEDNINYAREIGRNGTKVFLLNKPWNKGKIKGNSILRVENWEEILEIFGYKK